MRTILSQWSADPVGSQFRVRSPHATEDSLTPEFRRRVSMDDIEQIQERRWRPARPSCRRRFRSLITILETRQLQTPEPMQHLSVSHPFAHRPLVEFLLTIPPAVACRPGETRRLMRRAFTGLLPPMIARRQSKMAYAEMFRNALLPLAVKLLKQPGKMRLVELGFVDRASIADRMTRLTQGLECNESQLRHVVLLEYWLRRREAAPPALFPRDDDF